MKQSYKEIRIQRDQAWQELRDIRAAINADPNESTLDCVQMLMAKHEKLLSECERVLPKVEFTVDRLIYARDQAARIAIQDTAFATERAAAFTAHCDELHNADFEVCTDPRCRAVVVEEARRGLLDPGDVWPPIEPDDKPLRDYHNE